MKPSECEKCGSSDWTKVAQTDPPGGMMRVIDLKCHQCGNEIRIEVIFTRDENELLQ